MPYIVIHRLDQTIVLKAGNKHTGADHPQLRMVPPDQGFCAAKPRRVPGHIELGLIVQAELFPVNGSLEILHQFCVIQLRFMKRIIVNGNIPCIIIPHRVRSHLGPVEPPLHIQRFVYAGINAHTQAHFKRSILVVCQSCRYKIQERFIIVPVGAVHLKDICFPAAHDTASFMHDFFDVRTHPVQNPVRENLSVPFIDGGKTADINNDCIRLRILLVEVVLFCITVKKLAVKQTRKRIPFRRLQSLPGFKKFNGTPHAGQDDPGLRIGFLDKIAGTGVQTLDFLAEVGRCDNDRNVLILVRNSDPVQYFHPWHVRHEQVQENERDKVLLCP